jgi:hypothetical protein
MAQAGGAMSGLHRGWPIFQNSSAPAGLPKTQGKSRGDSLADNEEHLEE